MRILLCLLLTLAYLNTGIALALLISLNDLYGFINDVHLTISQVLEVCWCLMAYGFYQMLTCILIPYAF